MNPKVHDLLVNWSEEDVRKLFRAIRDIAVLFDRKHDTYPEHKYEGHAFYAFCLGEKTYYRDHAEWEELIGGK